jgi:hypothetical protein
MPHYPEEFPGKSPETLIDSARMILVTYQMSDTACPESARAIILLTEALAELDARTRDRYKRNVLGTSHRLSTSYPQAALSRVYTDSRHIYGERGIMPSKRTLELIVVTVIAMKPVFGLLHLWSAKALNEDNPGTLKHGVAEVLTVIA